MPAGELRLRLLGSFRATLGETDVTSAIHTQHERCLLAYLAVERQREHLRETLAELLWPDRPEGQARTNLRQALHGLRLALGEHAGSNRFLHVTDQTLQFNQASDHWIDVAVFRSALNAARRHAHASLAQCAGCLAQLQAAVDLYAGPFLGDLRPAGDQRLREWLAFHREQYLGELLAGLDVLADAYEARGEVERALELAQRQVAEAPLEESGQRRCMRLLAATGRRGAALTQFETCRRILADELGVAPEAETVALHAAIRAGQTAQLLKPTPAKPLPPAPAGPLLPQRPPGNLPASLGFFFGREAELARLAQCLRTATCRLLTLVGLPGAGSTRLALQAAHQNALSFPDGVWFVAAGEAGTAAELASGIGQALGLHWHPPDDPWLQLEGYLQPLTSLLILDGLQPAAADHVVGLLQRAAGLKVIVTANEQLGFQAACVFTVQGLACPPEPEMPGAQDYAAVQLFLAHQLRYGLATSSPDLVSIGRLCQLVDGLPLAIELAAAATRDRSCADLARDLEHDLDLLAVTFRDLPPRHRSLRAALDFAWARLTAAEQTVMRQAAVFPGDCVPAALQAIIGATPTLLTTLQEKSLLRRAADGRYGLPRLVRQYAAEKLEAETAEAAAVGERHARYYFEALTRQTPALARGPGVRRAGAELRADLVNVRQACAWAAAHRAVDIVRPGLLGLYLLFDQLNELALGERCFADLRAMLEADTGADTAAAQIGLAHTLSALGNFQRRQGKLAAATAQFERSLALVSGLGAQRERLGPLIGLGLVALRQGYHGKACAHLQQAVDLAQEAGDAPLRARASLHLLEAQSEHGELEQPVPALEACVQSLMAVDDLVGAARGLIAMGAACELAGTLPEAERYLNQALALAEITGDLALQARATYRLGTLAAALADHTLARGRLQMCLAANRRMGDRPYLARTLRALAELELHAGDVDAARRWLAGALEVAHETHMTPVILNILAGRAVILAGTGQVAQAFDLACFIQYHPSADNHTRRRAAELAADWRGQVEGALAIRLEAEARALPLEARAAGLRRWQFL